MASSSISCVQIIARNFRASKKLSRRMLSGPAAANTTTTLNCHRCQGQSQRRGSPTSAAALQNIVTRFYSKATAATTTTAIDNRTTPSVDDKQNILVESVNNGITLIAINRPEKRNCFNPATARQFLAAVKEFEENPNSPVAVIYGKGGTFSAGYDLSYISTLGDDPAAVPLDKYFFNLDVRDGVGLMGPSRRLFKKPVIAALSGYAVAGGLELALMCDLRVMEETAIMGVFCRRFGVPLIDGGTVRLPHLIGLSRAMDLILTGRPVKAAEAFEIGLANRICAPGASLGVAIQLAELIAKYPQECMSVDRKSALNAVYDAEGFEDAVRFELEKGLPIIRKESVQGATSFVKGVGHHGVDINEKNEK